MRHTVWLKEEIISEKSAVVPLSGETLRPEELKEALKQERDWLKKYNAVSAVNNGPVEDLEGIPLPADLHQGTPRLKH